MICILNISLKNFPCDNSVVESFFASFKKDEIYRHINNNFEELEKAIDEYIVFINTVRPHGSLSNRTPAEFDEDGLIKA